MPNKKLQSKQEQLTTELSSAKRVIQNASEKKPKISQNAVKIDSELYYNSDSKALKILNSKQTRYIWFLLVILLLLTVAIFYLNIQLNNKQQAEQIQSISESQLTNMTDTTANYITEKYISPKKYPRASYAQALAFANKGNYSKSLQIMQELTSTSVANYEFYMNYAKIASSSGDIKLAITNINQAILLLNDNETLNVVSKNQLLNRYNSIKSAYESEAK